MEENAELALLVGCSIAGRCLAAYLWPKQTLTSWFFASVGAGVGFVATLVIYPPVVIDPGFVILVLPFFAGAVGAAIEFFAKLVRLVRAKTERRQTRRNLATILLAGLVCGCALFLHERLHKFPVPPAPMLLPPDSN